MPVLVVIADLVASRDATDRNALQQQLQGVLGQLNHQQDYLSPYTITLGDEFQVLLTGADRIFGDAVTIQAAIYPTRVRFSLAIGELATEINRQQALGMDGPAFYAARQGIEELKRNRGLYQISGLPDATSSLANASLQLLSHSVAKWKQRRWAIAAALDGNRKVQAIASELGISEQAIYKNISDGGVEQVLAVFKQLAQSMDNILKSE